MDTKPVNELLDELLSALESLEAKSEATLLFLKQKGASEEELAPFLKQAGNASNVRWRAARLRIESLLSSVLKNVGESAAKEEKSSKDKEPLQVAKQGSEHQQEIREQEPTQEERPRPEPKQEEQEEQAQDQTRGEAPKGEVGEEKQKAQDKPTGEQAA
ncbi:MAG TPA: hypothetical protein VH437_10280 [Terriglobales bacterium]|jgi:hypothetical protein